jgi:hypothetical protein
VEEKGREVSAFEAAIIRKIEQISTTFVLATAKAFRADKVTTLTAAASLNVRDGPQGHLSLFVSTIETF